MVSRSPRATRRGFTLVELLVVMAIIATLLTVALPRYFGSIERSKEVTLKQSLSVLRDAIDQYHSDHDKYPDGLDALVQERYIRAVPEDPITARSDSWVVLPPPDASKGGVYDVKSGAEGKSSDGVEFGAL